MLVSTDVASPPNSASQLSGQELSNQYRFSTNGELGHLSTITYAIPTGRVEKRLPENFDTRTIRIDGQEKALISVSSFIDLGSKIWRKDSFEQTTYRLHALRFGNPVSYLLGSTVGSLSAIATRQLWHMPWRLGAMDFQINYSKDEKRYLDYRLSTQSQWVNAYWDITDNGEEIGDDEMNTSVLSVINRSSLTDYFQRRDGSIGLRRVHGLMDKVTRGTLAAARCDLLERIGLISADEISRPLLITLQPKLICTFDTPQSDIPKSAYEMYYSG